jgi:hypothetical protein
MHVADLVQRAREEFAPPLNFIEAAESVDLPSLSPGQNLEATLATLVTKTDRYRWRVAGQRYILYPEPPVWDEEGPSVTITDRPRLEAASEYVAALRQHTPELADLVEPPLKGDPRAALYTAPVSVTPKTPILEQLVQLLGTNERLAFTIERAATGRRMLHFVEVNPRSK